MARVDVTKHRNHYSLKEARRLRRIFKEDIRDDIRQRLINIVDNYYPQYRDLINDYVSEIISTGDSESLASLTNDELASDFEAFADYIMDDAFEESESKRKRSNKL